MLFLIIIFECGTASGLLTLRCWSKHPETDAMWRCYPYGNRAIRIRTRDDKLLVHTKKIFADEEQFRVYLEKVSYDLNKKSVLGQQINQMKDSLLPHETYFHKRPAFRHEGEYRLLIVDNSLYSAESLSSFGVKFKIEEQVKNKTDEEIIDYVTNKIYAQRLVLHPDRNHSLAPSDPHHCVVKISNRCHRIAVKILPSTGTDQAKPNFNFCLDGALDWNRNSDNDVRIEDVGDISEFLEGVMVHP